MSLPARAGQHFVLHTGTVSVLGHYHDIPDIRTWKWPAAGELVA